LFAYKIVRPAEEIVKERLDILFHALAGAPDSNKANLEKYVKRLQSKDDINRREILKILLILSFRAKRGIPIPSTDCRA